MQYISSKDFYKPCTYNFETKNQIWCTEIQDSHDIFCGCDKPFAHLLASIFPPEHKDRTLTINEILTRDYTQLCLSSGDAEESHGLAGGDGRKRPIKEEEKTTEEEKELDGLLAAAVDAAEGTR